MGRTGFLGLLGVLTDQPVVLEVSLHHLVPGDRGTVGGLEFRLADLPDPGTHSESGRQFVIGDHCHVLRGTLGIAHAARIIDVKPLSVQPAFMSKNKGGKLIKRVPAIQ